MERAASLGPNRLKPGLPQQPLLFISLLSPCDCRVTTGLPDRKRSMNIMGSLGSLRVAECSLNATFDRAPSCLWSCLWIFVEVITAWVLVFVVLTMKLGDKNFWEHDIMAQSSQIIMQVVSKPLDVASFYTYLAEKKLKAYRKIVCYKYHM